MIPYFEWIDSLPPALALLQWLATIFHVFAAACAVIMGATWLWRWVGSARRRRRISRRVDRMVARLKEDYR